MVRMIASLRGFLNRKGDGFPGPKTRWIGLQRVPDFVLALDAHAASGRLVGNGVTSLPLLGVPGGHIPLSTRADLETFPRRFRDKNAER